MPPPEDEERYGIDDLIGHEKRQMWFVVVVVVLAALYLTGREAFWDRNEGGEDGVAPVFSGG